MIVQSRPTSDRSVKVLPRRLTTSGLAKSGGDSPQVSLWQRAATCSQKYIKGKSENILLLARSLSQCLPGAGTTTFSRAWSPLICCLRNENVLLLTPTLSTSPFCSLTYDIQYYLTLWIQTPSLSVSENKANQAPPPDSHSLPCLPSLFLAHCCPRVTIWP